MDKPIFYEGQQVGCLMLGEGVIKSFMGLEFINVIINDGDYTYYIDGKYYENGRPTLYPIEQYRAIIAGLPEPQPEAWRPKPGEWCWFWVGNANSAVLNKFESYSNHTQKCRYKTLSGSYYDNCAPFTGELPEHLKEVQP